MGFSHFDGAKIGIYFDLEELSVLFVNFCAAIAKVLCGIHVLFLQDSAGFAILWNTVTVKKQPV